MWGSKPLLTVSMANRIVLTLQRLYTFTTIRVSMSLEVASLLNTFFGEWLGIHYEAFTKIL